MGFSTFLSGTTMYFMEGHIHSYHAIFGFWLACPPAQSGCGGNFVKETLLSYSSLPPLSPLLQWVLPTIVVGLQTLKQGRQKAPHCRG